MGEVAGVSTLGITFGYGFEETAGVKPTVFKLLTRINSIGEVTSDQEAIDASALEDYKTKRIRGRSDTGETMGVTVNWTPATYEEWKTVLDEYNKLIDGKRMWVQQIIPGFTDADFCVVQPPTFLPSPPKEQNSLLTVEIPLIIEDYIGMETKVDFETEEQGN